ncbi:hypothetical protein BASA62_001920 [Batrachochytrium salamandrivorans]|nr:hypothetical protein BASA62_001920 [Batrachochytrium salamandrivorans]
MRYWTDPTEVRQAVELLSAWVDIDVEDALELLGPAFSDTNVRSYAVSQLKKRMMRYLMVECEDKVVGKMYAKVAFQVHDCNDRGNLFSAMTCKQARFHSLLTISNRLPDGVNRRDILRRQGELVATISRISKELQIGKESRPRKIEKLREFIADPKNGLLSFPPLPLPLDAQVQVTGIIPEKASVFKSQLLPLHLTFSCLDGSEYEIIFKTGDDLRQDQLVVQIIMLMDKLVAKGEPRLAPHSI